MDPIKTREQLLADAGALLAALAGPPEPVNRSTFNAWSAAQRSAHCAGGGKVIDDAIALPEPAPAPGMKRAVATRAEFNAMTPQNRAQYLKLALPLRD